MHYLVLLKFCYHRYGEVKAIYFTLIVLLMSLTVSVMWLFLVVSWVGLQCVIVVFPGHTDLLFFLDENSLDSLVHLIDSNLNGSVTIYYFLGYFSKIRSIRRHLTNGFLQLSPNRVSI